MLSIIHISNTQALLDGLEERRNGGDSLRDMPQRFREPLDADHIAALKRVWSKAPPEQQHTVVNTMRDCWLKYFVKEDEGGEMRIQGTIAQYMEWAGIDSEEYPWFHDDQDGFPHLHVKHCYHTYHWIRDASK